MITGVDFTMLPTTDIERAIAFYTEVLELPMSARYGRVDGAEFETGNLTIALFDFAKVGGGDTAPHGAPIQFQVDDVPTVREKLEAKGVTFVSGLIDSGFCHQAMFKDPDGNTLALHHRYIPKEQAS